MEGLNGRGPVDYGIEGQEGGIVGVTEVKRDDFMKGVAQNMVQLESILWTRNGKSKKSKKGSGSFGIITNAETWFFLECGYEKKTMRNAVQEILQVIKWLLTQPTTGPEAQKALESPVGST